MLWHTLHQQTRICCFGCVDESWKEQVLLPILEFFKLENGSFLSPTRRLQCESYLEDKGTFYAKKSFIALHNSVFMGA